MVFKARKTNQMNFHEHPIQVRLENCCLCLFFASIATRQVPTTCNHR